MALKEMYDYLSSTTVNNDVTLSTPTPQDMLVEKGTKNVEIHLADDGSEERIGLATGSVFHATLLWAALPPADAGTIIDFYYSTGKGNGRLSSFKWSHPTDGHTYAVRFDCDVERTIRPASIHAISEIRLKILGNI